MLSLDPDAPIATPARRAPLALLALVLLAGAGVWAWRAQRPVPTAARPAPSQTPRPSPALASGGLDVSADVAGASLSLDGRALGGLPRQVRDVAPGRHVVRIEAPGRLPYEVDVHVVPGATTPVRARLGVPLGASSAAAPAAPVRDELRVDADVAGASVFVDRRLRGATPLVLRDVPAGSHRVNVTAPGYEMQALDVEVAGVTEVRVSFKEVRLDEAVDVQHKHGLGSCEGTLRATPAGLRYEPTRPGHAFSVPLTALERFEIDYLAKELRVKSGGKRWTFTTRAPNADPLLSFHQQVDRARRRL